MKEQILTLFELDNIAIFLFMVAAIAIITLASIKFDSAIGRFFGFLLIIFSFLFAFFEKLSLFQFLILIFTYIVVLIPIIIVSLKIKKKNSFKKAFNNRDHETVVSTNVELKGIDLEALEGKIGIAITDLKPFGKIKIFDEVFEVKTLGEFVEVGDNVEVLKVTSNKLIYVKRKGGKK